MDPVTEREIRALYQQACFGAGAKARNDARAEIKEIAERLGMHEFTALQYARCDLTAYSATRPIKS